MFTQLRATFCLNNNNNNSGYTKTTEEVPDWAHTHIIYTHRIYISTVSLEEETIKLTTHHNNKGNMLQPHQRLFTAYEVYSFCKFVSVHFP